MEDLAINVGSVWTRMEKKVTRVQGIVKKKKKKVTHGWQCSEIKKYPSQNQPKDGEKLIIRPTKCMQFSDGSLKHLTEHCTAILQQNQTKDTYFWTSLRCRQPPSPH